jgi:hypothetical protein
MPITHDGRIAARRALLDVVREAAEALRAAGAAVGAGADGVATVAPAVRDIDAFGTELIYAHYPAGISRALRVSLPLASRIAKFAIES